MGSIARARCFPAETEGHFDSLYRCALYLTPEGADAEDLLQCKLLQAYQSFHRFTPESNCGAWLVKIMKKPDLVTVRRRDAGRHVSADEPGFVLSRQNPAEELYAAPLTWEELILRKTAVEEE